MMTPGWILDILAAVMLVVAAVSAARLVAGRPWRRAAGDADIDAAHLLMSIAMAGMLVASLTTLPNDVWDVIFGAMTAWFAWRVYRESRGRGVRVLADSHHAPHLVHSAAMLYMFVALEAPTAGAGGAGMAGMGGGSGAAMNTLRLPAVAFIFALWLAAYVVLDLDRLSGPGHVHGSYFGRLAVTSAGAVLAGVSASPRALDLGAAATATAPASSGGSDAPVDQPQASGPGQPDTGGSDTGSTLGGSRTLLLSPQLAAGCRIAMGVTMAFMLIIMI